MIPLALKAWRAAAGLSQSQMAEVLGVPVGTYRSWEYGRRRPTGAAAGNLDLMHWLWVKHGRVFEDYRASVSAKIRGTGEHDSLVPRADDRKQTDKGEQ